MARTAGLGRARRDDRVRPGRVELRRVRAPEHPEDGEQRRSPRVSRRDETSSERCGALRWLGHPAFLGMIRDRDASSPGRSRAVAISAPPTYAPRRAAPPHPSPLPRARPVDRSTAACAAARLAARTRRPGDPHRIRRGRDLFARTRDPRPLRRVRPQGDDRGVREGGLRRRVGLPQSPPSPSARACGRAVSDLLDAARTRGARAEFRGASRAEDGALRRRARRRRPSARRAARDRARARAAAVSDRRLNRPGTPDSGRVRRVRPARFRSAAAARRAGSRPPRDRRDPACIPS